MSEKGNKEKDRGHLRLVKKDGPQDEGKQAEEPQDEAMDIPAISELYVKFAMEFTEKYYDDWDEFTSDEMERSDFLRTVIELDGAEMANPVIVFDASPAPTAKRPAMTPGNYKILDLTKIPAEDEDLLLWDFEARGVDYRITFIPLEAVRVFEKLLHDLAEEVIRENLKDGDAEEGIDPIFTIGYIREVVIMLHGLYREFSAVDDGFEGLDYLDELLNGDFDDSYFDRLEADFDEDTDEDLDEDDMLDGPHDWPPEVQEDFEKRVAEEMDNLKFNRVSIGRYIIVSRQ